MFKSLVRTFKGPSRDPRMAYISRPLPRDLRDVTGAFTKTMVMIRDGDVGRWPGYAAMSYPLIAPSERIEETRRAIVAADAGERGDAPPPGPKPGWDPPPPPERS